MNYFHKNTITKTCLFQHQNNNLYNMDKNENLYCLHFDVCFNTSKHSKWIN